MVLQHSVKVRKIYRKSGVRDYSILPVKEENLPSNMENWGYGKNLRMFILDISLDATTKVVYSYLRCYGDRCFPSETMIADELALSVTTVKKAIKALRNHGYIKITKLPRKYGAAPNQYIIANDMTIVERNAREAAYANVLEMKLKAGKEDEAVSDDEVAAELAKYYPPKYRFQDNEKVRSNSDLTPENRENKVRSNSDPTSGKVRSNSDPKYNKYLIKQDINKTTAEAGASETAAATEKIYQSNGIDKKLTKLCLKKYGCANAKKYLEFCIMKYEQDCSAGKDIHNRAAYLAALLRAEYWIPVQTAEKERCERKEKLNQINSERQQLIVKQQAADSYAQNKLFCQARADAFLRGDYNSAFTILYDSIYHKIRSGQQFDKIDMSVISPILKTVRIGEPELRRMVLASQYEERSGPS